MIFVVKIFPTLSLTPLKLYKRWMSEKVLTVIIFILGYIFVTAPAFSMQSQNILIRRCKMLLIIYDCGNIKIIDDEIIYCPPFQKEEKRQTEKSTSNSEKQEE